MAPSSYAAIFILFHRDALKTDSFLNAIGRLMLYNCRANDMALPRLKDDRDIKVRRKKIDFVCLNRF